MFLYRIGLEKIFQKKKIRKPEFIVDETLVNAAMKTYCHGWQLNYQIR